MLFVTNIENGKTLIVRLNDRGPFIGDRIIDLSKASAQALGITGLGQVRVQYAGPADPMASNRAPARPPVEVARPAEQFVEAPVETPWTAPAPTPTPIPAQPFTPPTLAPYVPDAPMTPTAPEAVGTPEAQPEGQITLTIKGPIHVANYKGQDARLIRERLQTK
jgi:rare lipoprotein A